MQDFETNIKILINSLQKTIQMVLKKVDLDNSNLAKNIEISYINNTVVISAPDYIEFVDKGRKPSKKIPPVQDIMKWIKEKNIEIPRGLSLKSFAFAVSKSIAKYGYKGKFFLEKMYYECSELIKSFVINNIDKTIKNI